jgi:branched-chain amino acid transport system substrate-binding protein
MKKLLMATAATALMTGSAFAGGHGKEVKIGVILGFTGPLESITPAMGAGAELAMAEVTKSGMLLDAAEVISVRADSTCIDAGAATSAAERLVTADKVDGIMGADCSGVTGAILANVARANGVVMISPSATSPGLSTAEDDGLFFRTAPSDARQGVIITNILQDRGVDSVALTYTNNDYGKGLADAFQASFEAAGGTVTIAAAHEDGKADYSAEVGALASAGGDVLVVAGYVDQGGSGVIRAAIDTGAFDTFYVPDGMVGEKLNENFGEELDGSYGAYPGTNSDGFAKFVESAKAAGFDGTGAFSPESYDAAALLMLAMEAANSKDPADYKNHVMDVANAPGIEIKPGQLGEGLALLKAGFDIDYVGASAVELIGAGESAGNYKEIEFKDGVYSTIGYR